MENFLIILACVAVCMVLACIFIYNYFDRLRFRMERQLKYRMEDLEKWASLCGALEPGSDQAFRAAKKLPDRMQSLAGMAQSVKTNSEEKLDLQESLLEFCFTYNETAEHYNARLTWPVLGAIARRLGFRHFAKLDFYPDVKGCPQA